VTPKEKHSSQFGAPRNCKVYLALDGIKKKKILHLKQQKYLLKERTPQLPQLLRTG